jgi:hypothetical protein
MFDKFPITEQMHIHSLDGALREASIVEKTGDNQYVAEYNGVRAQPSSILLWAASMWTTSTESSGRKHHGGMSCADSMLCRLAWTLRACLESEVWTWVIPIGSSTI